MWGWLLGKQQRKVYAGFQMWSGDLPSAYFGIGDTTYVLSGRARPRGWTVYTNFVAEGPFADEFDGQPKWAMLVTNGATELFLSPNAGKCYLQFVDAHDALQVITEISEEEAKRLRYDFETDAIKTGGSFKRHDKRHRIKPHGCAVTWTADVRTLTASLSSLTDPML